MKRRRLGIPLALAAAGALACAPHSVSAQMSEDKKAFLDHECRRAEWWNWSWRGIFAVGAAGSAGFAMAADDRGRRIDWSVSAVKSSIALGSAFVWSVDCDDLSESERKGRGLVRWLGVVGLNAGAFAYLGPVEGRWKSATLSALSGLAIGALRIYTQPDSAVQLSVTTSGVALAFAF